MTSVITLNSGMAFADTSPEARLKPNLNQSMAGNVQRVNVAQKSALKNKN